MHARLGAVVVLGLVLMTVACAGGETGPVASPGVPGSPTSAPAPTTSATPTGESGLTIVVDDGTGATTTWTLTCDPIGGTHPDPKGACAALRDHRAALDPVPKGKMCAQVYSGPERATISGTWGAERVFATLSRTDACETARWDALVPLIPAGGR